MVTEINDVKAISKGNVLIDFYTSTCGPCKALNPILEEISNKFKNLKVAKVEVTQNPDVTQMFGVMSVPTIVFMKDCQVCQVVRGVFNKEVLETMVKKYYND